MYTFPFSVATGRCGWWTKTNALRASKTLGLAGRITDIRGEIFHEL
jgi:hypothetical protein